MEETLRKSCETFILDIGDYEFEVKMTCLLLEMNNSQTFTISTDLYFHSQLMRYCSMMDQWIVMINDVNFISAVFNYFRS
jgi:hypothetical protein